MRARTRWAVAPIVAVVALCVFDTATRAQFPQIPHFRAGVTLVPIEVRVLDREGNPVPGLTQADFTVREDRRPQEIAHFQAVKADGSSEIARNFFIVLGRGRLNEPTKAVQALIDFVRTTVRPADRIGVFAYNRVIDLTTNHGAVARFLEYYRDRHDATESRIARDNATYALPRKMSPATRDAIEGHFNGSADVKALTRDLAGGAGDALSRFNDWHYLKTTLQYLTMESGEKHVVVLTQRQFPAPRQSDDPLENYLFKLATSARATLSFIHTGGVRAPSMYRGTGILSSSPQNLRDMNGRSAQRDLADQTGGTSAFFQYAAKPLDALNRATSAYNVLGYYPISEVLPEQYRRVEVSVRGEGLTLLYRHGFQARPAAVEESSIDYRQAIAEARTEEALARIEYSPSSGPVGFFWEMRLSAKAGKRTADAETLKVTVAFDPLLTMFTKQGSEHVVDVDLTLLADDEKRNVIGEHRQRLHISLTEAELKRSKRQWPTFDIEFEVNGRAAFVRGVLFQFETDRAASKRVKVQR